ncbi:unnamed protein product [Boreogadus saida]
MGCSLNDFLKDTVAAPSTRSWESSQDVPLDKRPNLLQAILMLLLPSTVLAITPSFGQPLPINPSHRPSTLPSLNPSIHPRNPPCTLPGVCKHSVFPGPGGRARASNGVLVLADCVTQSNAPPGPTSVVVDTIAPASTTAQRLSLDDPEEREREREKEPPCE